MLRAAIRTRSSSEMNASSVAGQEDAVASSFTRAYRADPRQSQRDVLLDAPLGAAAPASMPPWPGSMTMTRRLSRPPTAPDDRSRAGDPGRGHRRPRGRRPGGPRQCRRRAGPGRLPAARFDPIDAIGPWAGPSPAASGPRRTCRNGRANRPLPGPAFSFDGELGLAAGRRRPGPGRSSSEPFRHRPRTSCNRCGRAARPGLL